MHPGQAANYGGLSVKGKVPPKMKVLSLCSGFHADRSLQNISGASQNNRVAPWGLFRRFENTSLVNRSWVILTSPFFVLLPYRNKFLAFTNGGKWATQRKPLLLS